MENSNTIDTDKIYANLINLRSLYNGLSRFKKEQRKEESLEYVTLEDFSDSGQFNRTIWAEYENELSIMGFDYSNRKNVTVYEFEYSIRSSYSKLLQSFSSCMENIESV